MPPWWEEHPRLFTALAGIGNLLLLVYVVLVNVVSQAKVLGLGFDGLQEAALVAGTLLGVLAQFTGLFSLWLVVVGVAAILAVGYAAVGVVLQLLRLLLRPFERRAPPHPAADGGHAWRSPALSKDRSEWGAGSEPVGDFSEPPPPRHVHPAPYRTSVVLAGDFGRRLLPEMLAIRAPLALKGVARVAGLAVTGGTPSRELARSIRKAGIVNVGTTPAERDRIRAISADEPEEVQRILELAIFRAVEHTPPHAGKELVLFGIEVDQFELAVPALEQLHRTVPRGVIVPVVELELEPASAHPHNPAARHDRHAAATAAVAAAPSNLSRTLDRLETLYEQGVIACAVLVQQGTGSGSASASVSGSGSGSGSWARQVLPRALWWRLMANSLNGLLHTQQHFDAQLTAAHLLERVGARTPFLTLAVGSIGLHPGGKLAATDPGRWAPSGSHGRPGRGDAVQTRGSLEQLAESLLHDHNAWLLPVAPDPQRGAIIAEAFIPYGDPRQKEFHQVNAGLEQWLAAEIPGAQFVALAAPGVRMPGVGTRYWGGWTWWYGVSRADMDQILARTARTAGSAAGAQRADAANGKSAAGGDGGGGGSESAAGGGVVIGSEADAEAALRAGPGAGVVAAGTMRTASRRVPLNDWDAESPSPTTQTTPLHASPRARLTPSQQALIRSIVRRTSRSRSGRQNGHMRERDHSESEQEQEQEREQNL